MIARSSAAALATLILAAVILAAATPVRADEKEPAIDCANAMSTAEINFCSEKLLDAADAKLNEAYKKALDFVAKTEGEKPYDAKSWEEALRASQRAWVAYRDADCKGLVPMSWSGGTGTTAEVLGCMSAKTKARTQELLEMYEPK